MKKMFGIIVVLLIFYVALQAAYSYMAGSQVNTYNLFVNDVKYDITEKYTNKHKDETLNIVEQSNYYYEVTLNEKLMFSFKIAGKYIGVKEYLKELIVYKNENYTCAYPIFKDKVENMDVICNSGDKYYLYASLKGKDAGIDTFIGSLKEKGYTHPSWDTTNMETKHIGTFDMYINNIAENQNITLWQYKGFYRLTNRGENLFSLDISDRYDPILTSMVNQYFVVPDYKKDSKFDRVFITNLITGKIEPFNLGVTISYDSFVQGVIDNKIYLVDRSSKAQYVIDIYKKETKLSGDINNNTKYYNSGKWEPKTIYEVIDNNLQFVKENTAPESLKAYNPLFIGEVGGSTEGYYYLYIKENNAVGVYRVDKQNTNIMTLLFTVPSINNIKYEAKDIYFISNDTLYVYRDTLGAKPLVKYNEFVFNKGNLYNVYVNR